MTLAHQLDAARIGAHVTATCPTAPPTLRACVYVKISEQFWTRSISGILQGNAIKAEKLAKALGGEMFRDVVVHSKAKEA